MGIFQLNHAVLYVSDLDRSVDFYTTVLGLERLEQISLRGAAFLRAAGSTNDHDLGLFEVPGATASRAGRATAGLYHLAWEVDTLDELERVATALADAGALAGASDHGTTKSLYGRDPDGLEFEVVWIIPADLVTEADREAASRIGALDLGRERARFGGGTRGGVGISHAAPTTTSHTPPVASPGRVSVS
jgi:catechol-2,3-dioxygenase